MFPLAWIFEFWKWTDSDWTAIGVLLVVYGAYGVGFAQAGYPTHENESFGEGLARLPLWLQLAFLSAVIGFVILIGIGSGCADGEYCGP